MTRVIRFLIGSAFAFALYAPAAHAQYSGLPNQDSWNHYLTSHPKAAAELQANPSLLYNPSWRSQHEHLEQWLNNHPSDWKAMKQPAQWQSRYGAWDPHSSEWHDQDWWYHHNPNWAHQNHPDWWKEHKDWVASKNDKSSRFDEPDEDHDHDHDHGNGNGQGNGNGKAKGHYKHHHGKGGKDND